MEPTSFTTLLKNIEQKGDEWIIDLPQDWAQGRTAFGGIVCAFLYETAKQQFPDLAPLRTAQINFVGPASGTLTMRHEIVRAGKNMTTVESKLYGEKGLATQALFVFGRALPAETNQAYPIREVPEITDTMTEVPPHGPSFLMHIDRRTVKSAPFLSGTHHPEFLLWLRSVDKTAHSKFATLLMIGDAPPPAALAATTTLSAISSINWTFNMLQDDPKTEDGWWLMESITKHIQHGYSSQHMTIWNKAGERVMDAIQHIAVFE